MLYIIIEYLSVNETVTPCTVNPSLQYVLSALLFSKFYTTRFCLSVCLSVTTNLQLFSTPLQSLQLIAKVLTRQHSVVKISLGFNPSPINRNPMCVV